MYARFESTIIAILHSTSIPSNNYQKRSLTGTITTSQFKKVTKKPILYSHVITSQKDRGNSASYSWKLIRKKEQLQTSSLVSCINTQLKKIWHIPKHETLVEIFTFRSFLNLGAFVVCTLYHLHMSHLLIQN